MDRDAALAEVLNAGLVAVVRSSDPKPLIELARALVGAGLKAVEITLTVPKALTVIEWIADELGDTVLLGAGTVLDAETARAALLAGANFVVSPVLDTAMIELCRRYDKLIIPGCMTPTEALTAWKAGADIVKVFPSDSVGPAFFRAMRGPLPQIRLMPTGGVTVATGEEYLRAGAVALGVGSTLIHPAELAGGQFEAIAARATEFLNMVTRVRAERAKP